jgi:hypothetical protein
MTIHSHSKNHVNTHGTWYSPRHSMGWPIPVFTSLKVINCILSPLSFTMNWDIDLIFGMRVYSHKLQINFEIRSGWMVFGQLTAVGLWNLAQLMTFNEVNTGIGQPMECLGEYHVPWVDQFLYSPKLKIINCFIIYTCMTLKQIWINTKQRRLCSPDIPVCPTSAIINLIVYRK